MHKLTFLLAAFLFGSAAFAADDSGPVLAPAKRVLGKTAEDYSISWWQWAMANPPGSRAYEDRDGSRCAENQGGSVWYLAGTNGKSVVERHCRVPAQVHLFFPVINMLYYSRVGGHPTCDAVRAGAAANNDALQHAIVKLDGKIVPDVTRFRARGRDCFDAFERASYVRDRPARYPAASDGYWIMLKPLSPGTHHLSVRANYANPDGDNFGEMVQYFDYVLEVGGAGI
jgi:hypothetical protein